jgi:hypothetical protein
MSINDTISNIQFDWAFLHSIKNQERTDKVGADKIESGSSIKGYANGVPFQHYVLFKTVCLMPDNKDGVTTRDLRQTCQNVFGLDISQPAISRAVASLKDVGLLEGINNPVGLATFSWIKLTNKGRKLQRLFLGSTSEWKDRLRVVNIRDLQENISVEGLTKKRTA